MAMTRGVIAALAFALFPGVAHAEGEKLGAPITFRNLTLIPLYPAGSARPEEYLVLDEGMDKGLVKVREKESGGSVNEVVLENRSDKALFLMAGEVILGGKQDRVIGKDTIVPAKETTTLPVFCVEHGRWDGGERASFSSGKSLAHGKLRAKARYKAQGEVWQEVAEKNVARATENATDTYRTVATDKRIDKAVGDYATHFQGALAKAPRAAEVVGFVMVMNGKIVGMESFRSPKLFAKFQGKLLRSYYVEAIDAPVSKAPPAVPTEKQVREFAADARKAKAKQEVMKTKAAETYNFEGSAVEGTIVRDQANPAAAPVYETYMAK